MSKDEIISMVNDALDIAYLQHIDDGVDFGPVNWADLELGELVGTHDGWIAYVEEASPDAEQLRLFVLAWLERAGVENVSVVTQW